MPGVTVKDVSPHEFVKAYAAYLKKQDKIKLPEMLDLIKTGPMKELAPYNDNWFYVRCAALARRLYVRQGTGVGGFSKVFGGKKRRGTLPGHFTRASRGILRKALQELENIGVLEKMPEKAGGRRITKKGQQDLDRIACEIFANKE
ncbi:small subunit ribosomal protein S19e, cytoplasmic [Guillardia theta CCMP2712]|nr:small subunit ribosomal protein S19e, cytoplasmic [Guillardia theta CCMP2712]EKX43885.1 small subunit ribosomal protein S19e, cytoplasmic [Guillardia theta CCMP2712]|eukprot:XP_005830865.1 small subunit ribosomal protein S19e, cytoplasmic [Guillardia theta CCMP2712]